MLMDTLNGVILQLPPLYSKKKEAAAAARTNEMLDPSLEAAPVAMALVLVEVPPAVEVCIVVGVGISLLGTAPLPASASGDKLAGARAARSVKSATVFSAVGLMAPTIPLWQCLPWEQ